MNYVPGQVPNDPKAIPAFLQLELQRLAQVFASEQDALLLRELHAEPGKKLSNMVVSADGTDWDPGSGRGYYGWDGSSWIFLG